MANLLCLRVRVRTRVMRQRDWLRQQRVPVMTKLHHFQENCAIRTSATEF